MSSSSAPRVLRLPVAGTRRETPSILTISFDLGEAELDYQPGQHVSLKVDGVDDPRGPRRPFTLSSSPTEEGGLAITTRLTDSLYKDALEGLEEGRELEVRGPFGSFVLEPDRPAVMITGGIGITPFRSMIRFAADRRLEIPIVCLYSNRTPREIAFREELDRLAAQHRPLRIAYTITRPEEAEEAWEGRTGRIDAGLIRQAAEGLEEPLYYVCGPPSMVGSMSALLEEEVGVAGEDVRFEEFTGY